MIKSFIFKLKELLQGIKFYLPVVLFFTTVLGGLWQFIELFLIHPSFIRFFSPTQVLADGILVAFIFFIASSLLLVGLLSVGILWTYYEKIDINIKPKNKLEHFNIWALLKTHPKPNKR